jgi:histidinol-phosphate aminotransferase
MGISRRALLRRIGATAAVGAAVPSFSRAPLLAASSDLEPRVAGPVRLHLNENAAGPSPSVMAAIRDLASRGLHRYPETEVAALREKLAEAHDVPASNIVLGCGSTDIIRMAAGAYAGAGTNVIAAIPTFDMMAEAASATGTDLIEVPLTSSHAHDLDAMLSKVNGATRLVYVCNPNNPTGTLTRRRDLEQFVSALPAGVHVVIDEAYHHYAAVSSEYASFIDRPIGDSRIIVTRTFSTVHALAGLRVGYAVAAPEVTERLAAIRLPNSVSAVAAIAAMSALADVEHVRRSVRRNTDDRQEFFNQANARMLRPLDTHANFAMLDTGRPGAAMVEHFRTNGVLVSPPVYGFPKSIRVSMGTAEEMLRFWRVFDLLPPLPTMRM